MVLSLILALQAAGQAPAPAALTPVEFDLARYRAAGADPRRWDPACASDDPSAVVVCGRRTRSAADSYPLEEMARRFMPGRFIAETGLFGNATGSAFVESVELSPGMTSTRAMIGIRFPF